jgi:hypothetical protein
MGRGGAAVQGVLHRGRVRDNDGAFTGYGFIRKPCPVGTGLPFETSFDSSERYPTEKAAREAGLAFAKRKIDGR